MYYNRQSRNRPGFYSLLTQSPSLTVGSTGTLSSSTSSSSLSGLAAGGTGLGIVGTLNPNSLGSGTRRSLIIGNNGRMNSLFSLFQRCKTFGCVSLCITVIFVLLWFGLLGTIESVFRKKDLDFGHSPPTQRRTMPNPGVPITPAHQSQIVKDDPLPQPHPPPLLKLEDHTSSNQDFYPGSPRKDSIQVTTVIKDHHSGIPPTDVDVSSQNTNHKSSSFFEMMHDQCSQGFHHFSTQRSLFSEVHSPLQRFNLSDPDLIRGFHTVRDELSNRGLSPNGILFDLGDVDLTRFRRPETLAERLARMTSASKSTDAIGDSSERLNSHSSSPLNTVSFVMLGDWGVANTLNPELNTKHLSRVSRSMEHFCSVKNQTAQPCDFVLSVGDHFYENDVVDPLTNVRWSQGFEAFFRNPPQFRTLPTLPWFLVAGNHDWRVKKKPSPLGVDAQLKRTIADPSKQWCFPNPFYTFRLISGKLRVRFVMLDTSTIWDRFPFVFGKGGKRKSPPIIHDDGLNPDVSAQIGDDHDNDDSDENDDDESMALSGDYRYLDFQLKWLDSVLKHVSDPESDDCDLIIMAGHVPFAQDPDFKSDFPFERYQSLMKQLSKSVESTRQSSISDDDIVELQAQKSLDEELINEQMSLIQKHVWKTEMRPVSDLVSHHLREQSERATPLTKKQLKIPVYLSGDQHFWRMESVITGVNPGKKGARYLDRLFQVVSGQSGRADVEEFDPRWPPNKISGGLSYSFAHLVIGDGSVFVQFIDEDHRQIFNQTLLY